MIKFGTTSRDFTRFFHFTILTNIPHTLDENKFLAIRIVLPPSLHSNASCKAIFVTFPTINPQLHSFPCHVPHTQLPVEQLYLPRFLHPIPSCTATYVTVPTLNSQLHSYPCHVP